MMDFNTGLSIGNVLSQVVNFFTGNKTSTTVTQQQQTTQSQSVQNRSLQQQPLSIEHQGTAQTPTTSNIDSSSLPSGSHITSVTKGTVGGSQSYIATVTNAKGETETYSVNSGQNGTYSLGSKLTQSVGSGNYTDNTKLDAAIKKEFGDGFTLPDGYSASLVGDTLVIKDAQGKTLDAAAINELKSAADT